MLVCRLFLHIKIPYSAKIIDYKHMLERDITCWEAGIRAAEGFPAKSRCDIALLAPSERSYLVCVRKGTGLLIFEGIKEWISSSKLSLCSKVLGIRSS